MRRALSCLMSLTVLAALVATSAPATADGVCTDAADEALLTAFGRDEGLSGRFALPEEAPRHLVVFAHGYGHDSSSWVDHLRATAERGAIAVAMDYRGTRYSELDGETVISGWPVWDGALDSIAAARHFLASCSSLEEVTMFGVSMGGNVSGIAVSLGEQKADGSPLFDRWFDIEGATNVLETYAGASALAPVNAFAARAQADIEDETGGTPAEVPDAYAARTVVVRAPMMADLGGAVLVHGVDDGLVPYNQSREMAAALRAVGVPTDVYTVATRGDGESGTTATGYIGGPLADGLGLPAYQSPLAGHASESSSTHLVMRTGLDLLWGVIDGDGIGGDAGYREFVVDGEAGTLPPR